MNLFIYYVLLCSFDFIRPSWTAQTPWKHWEENRYMQEMQRLGHKFLVAVKCILKIKNDLSMNFYSAPRQSLGIWWEWLWELWSFAFTVWMRPPGHFCWKKSSRTMPWLWRHLSISCGNGAPASHRVSAPFRDPRLAWRSWAWSLRVGSSPFRRCAWPCWDCRPNKLDENWMAQLMADQLILVLIHYSGCSILQGKFFWRKAASASSQSGSMDSRPWNGSRILAWQTVNEPWGECDWLWLVGILICFDVFLVCSFCCVICLFDFLCLNTPPAYPASNHIDHIDHIWMFGDAQVSLERLKRWLATGEVPWTLPGDDLCQYLQDARRRGLGPGDNIITILKEPKKDLRVVYGIIWHNFA